VLKPRAAVSEGPRRRPRRPMTWAQGGGGDGGRTGTPLGRTHVGTKATTRTAELPEAAAERWGGASSGTSPLLCIGGGEVGPRASPRGRILYRWWGS
jgi:hypothetical protein